MKWWHGGPVFTGDWVLPPRETGAKQLHEWLGVSIDELNARVDHAPLVDPCKVYITNAREAALCYAVTHKPCGRLYLVEPVGELEDDPDFTCEDDDTIRSVRCARARIIRREQPSRHEVDAVLRYMASEAARL